MSKKEVGPCGAVNKGLKCSLPRNHKGKHVDPTTLILWVSPPHAKPVHNCPHCRCKP